MSDSERVALVVGGSRGIGRAIAERLGAGGTRLAISSRNPKKAVEELRADGVDALAIELDLVVGRPAAATEATLDAFGRLDILVYSSGTNVRKPILETSLEEWRLIQRLNLEAAFLTAQACAPHMLGQRWGRMLFVGSVASFTGGAMLPITAYCASKAGLMGLVRGLAKEWAEGGIRVNSLAPGFTATELTSPVRGNPALNESIHARIPVGRWAEAGDMAAAGAFLCSEEAEYITGQALVVDGGFLVS